MKTIKDIIKNYLTYLNTSPECIDDMIEEWSDLNSNTAQNMEYYEWIDYMNNKYKKFTHKPNIKAVLTCIQRVILDELKCDHVIHIYLYEYQRNDQYYLYSSLFPQYHQRKLDRDFINCTNIKTLNNLECLICNKNKNNFYICHRCLKYTCKECKHFGKCPFCLLSFNKNNV